LGVLSPTLSFENDLGDLLPGPEAVINSATSKALLPEFWMDAATVVRLQPGTGLSGFFVDREVR
jgi:hypothetical protein